MFADDIVICSEIKEQVEEKLESWRYALERRGMKVNRRKTEQCMNERQDNGSSTVKMQGEEMANVEDFKYLQGLKCTKQWRVRKRSEESTGRMEWVEKNVRSDLRQASTS